MITPRERLLNVLRKTEVDRPPCICPGGMMNMIVRDVMMITGAKWPEAHVDAEKMADLTEGIYNNGGFENFGVPFCMTVEAESMGAQVFMGTDITEPRVTEYPIKSVSEWRQLTNMDVTKGRAKVVLDAISILKKRNPDVPVIGNLTGPVSLASSLVEPMDYYKEIRRKPKEAAEFMDFVADNLIVFGKAQIEAGADIIAISDPSGTGEILGPKMFSEFAATYINKVLSALKPLAKGGTIVHICGRLKSVYKELNELQSDAISFDSITSVKEVIENVKDKAIMGNLSTLAIEKNNSDSVKNLGRVCIRQGVDILSPACGIGARTPLDNIRAMVEAAKEGAQGDK
ncbi:[methyl-Co(III) methanol-specific corrinoid protein]:coenzyme M methyltransferase [Hathewaya proteolytica DSM 3090]|uniref:[methyl-Co(III) methanol-specific corrinoid protein]:coenzyme M methyltransferase n=1 Tax=Hathewaya proteolytica DSM 3090 TaxID=1121331 RepID=A0A1M6MBW9_9CLOT|nr:methylcobamide:CoM methyltransferase MtbA [Hathewaya proteolytica]SHJ80956.1 [methyl-Co(III) methanol-specific corrinoid protein]:coenzyme M methyltransferase [Hathewaya proteolytica DSM 3090]